MRVSAGYKDVVSWVSLVSVRIMKGLTEMSKETLTILVMCAIMYLVFVLVLCDMGSVQWVTH